MSRHAFRKTVRLPLVLAILCAGCTNAPVTLHREGRLARLPVVPPADLTRQHEDVLDASPGDLLTAERLARGYTIVVVGVNGDNSLSAGLAPGLVDGGYPGAVDVIDWTTGYWPLFVYHLRSGARHDAGARAIVDKVAAYQAQFPRGEVNLIGYSAGAAVVLEALEELPDGVEIDRAILLAGAVSPMHNLSPALGHCRLGMWNYYQPQDIVALWAGTIVAGTADGTHLVSAGAIGFWPPADPSAKSRYETKLFERCYEPGMVRHGSLGGHFQCVSRKFAAGWVAPLLVESRHATAKTEAPTADVAGYSMPTSPNVSLPSRVASAK